jgi:hypothetical protein
MPSITKERVFSHNRSDVSIAFKERCTLSFKEQLASSAISRDSCSDKIAYGGEMVNGIRVMTQNILVVVIGESIESNGRPAALAHYVRHQRVRVFNVQPRKVNELGTDLLSSNIDGWVSWKISSGRILATQEGLNSPIGYWGNC